MKYIITLFKNGDGYISHSIDNSLSNGITTKSDCTIFTEDTKQRAIDNAREHINSLIESRLEDILNLNKQLKALNSI